MQNSDSASFLPCCNNAELGLQVDRLVDIDDWIEQEHADDIGHSPIER